MEEKKKGRWAAFWKLWTAPEASLPPRNRLFITRPASVDKVFLVSMLLVLVVGLISLYSASYAYSYYMNDGDSYYYISSQIKFVILGLVLMTGISFVDYHVLHWLAFPIFVISELLLGVVLLLPATHGVHRWIKFTAAFRFQPSELAKFAIVLLFAHLIVHYKDDMKKAGKGFWSLIGFLGAACVLILPEPHLSGTILVAALGFAMMFIGGTRGRWLGLLVAAGVVLVFVAVFVLGYEKDRFDVLADPLGVYNSNVKYDETRTGRDVAWQTVQSLYAIGSGGLIGEGFGNSRQKHLFLPEPQNDFIFSIVCEELGWIGAVVIILLFVFLLWRGFMVGMQAPDKFGSLLAIGITTQLGLQVVMNLAVISNSMPNTGISLPFFSYGGSSMIMLLMEMGVMLSISRHGRYYAGKS